MEQTSSNKTKQNKSAIVSTTALRVRKETKRRIVTELGKINKKDFGKKVRIDDLLLVLLPHLTDVHVKQLQERSMTGSDRLEMQYRAYVAKSGQISKEDYIGKLMTGEIAILQIQN